MADLLSTGISALLSFQRGLDTASNNIANANTPGYTRQVAQFEDLPGQTTRTGYVGSGVRVQTVRRVYDQFLNLQLQSAVSGESRLATMDALAGQVDRLVADPLAGLTPRLQGFFSAVQDVGNDPSSIPARQALLGEADALAVRFRSIDERLAELGNEVNGRLQGAVGEINRLSGAIADLNDEIALAGNRSRQPPNGLLDQRDRLLKELAGLVDISTVNQDDGAVNVFVGSGQSLVLGGRAESLGAVADEFDPSRLRVVYRTAGGAAPLADGSLGGAIGGLQDFRNGVLDPARAALGQTASALAAAFNEQHSQGMDLNGGLGGRFFDVEAPAVLTSQNNSGSGSASVSVSDVGALQAAAYVLAYDGAAYTLTRSDTGQAVPLAGSGTALDPFVAEGLEIVVGGAPAAGDRLQILATRGAASGFGVSIEDPGAIAAAAPSRSRVGADNLGDALISATEIVDSSADLLLPSVISFTSPSTYTVNGAGSFAYTSGEPITVNGSQFTISGAPVAGDEFFLEPNLGGSGDNRNALRLAGLQTDGVLEGGTVSISDSYAGLVADVGNEASQINASLSAQSVLLANVEQDVASKSGVNLDEEAANLLRFQQAYEASAQIIAVTNTLFDTLLGALRR